MKFHRVLILARGEKDSFSLKGECENIKRKHHNDMIISLYLSQSLCSKYT